MACHHMKPWHGLGRHVKARDAMPCHRIPRHRMAYNGMACHATARHATASRVVAFRAAPRYAVCTNGHELRNTKDEKGTHETHITGRADRAEVEDLLTKVFKAAEHAYRTQAGGNRR